jgi:hypothetical protein
MTALLYITRLLVSLLFSSLYRMVIFCNILYYGYDIVYYLLHTLNDQSNPPEGTNNKSILFEK